MKTRFAPSPTGYLHLGHAYSALIAEREAGGAPLVLRIEDIDSGRCRPEFEEAILEDLAWLGLRWEQSVRRQSEHFDDYAAALDQLADMEVLYPCFCTRREIAAEIAGAADAPHGPEGRLYPGICRRVPAEERRCRMQSEPYALRLDVGAACRRVPGPLTFTDRGRGPQQARPELLGDVVLARKDFPASYHLAVVVDDALQGIGLVTRGEDLFHATHVQRLLQDLLRLPAPEYAHHRLILDESGRRYSKRDHAVTLRALRGGGASAADIRRDLGFGL